MNTNNLSFTEVDSIFEAQMQLSMDWAEKFRSKLRHLTTSGRYSLNTLTEKNTLEFYPNISNTQRVDGALLNACLEQTKEFLFGDGLPVKEKIALLQYHFTHSFDEIGPTSLKEMLDQVTVCGQGSSLYADEWSTLSSLKRQYISQSLPKLAETRVEIEKNDHLVQQLTKGKEDIQQKLNGLLKAPDDETSKTCQRLASLIQQADGHIRQSNSEQKQLKEEMARLFKEFVSPLEDLTYNTSDLQQGVGKIVAQIVEQAQRSQLSAMPQALSPQSVVIARDNQTADVNDEDQSVRKGNTFVG